MSERFLNKWRADAVERNGKTLPNQAAEKARRIETCH